MPRSTTRPSTRRWPHNGPLTGQQQIFIAEYLKDGNATRAAMAAGVSERSAQSQGWQWLDGKRYPRVAMAVRDALEERRQVSAIHAEEAIKELARIVRFNFKHLFDFEGNLRPVDELPDAIAMMVQDIEVEERSITTDDGTEIKKKTARIKSLSKMEAWKLILQMLGLIPKGKGNGTVNINIDWNAMLRPTPLVEDDVEKKILALEAEAQGQDATHQNGQA